MKKFISMLLVIALTAAISVGATMAYLTDTDEDVNVMTLGNVSIAQHEYERVVNADGTYEMVTSPKYGEGYKLQPFTQAKPLYPATGAITGWGTIVPFDQIKGASGSHSVLAGLNNVQDKFVLVENTGKTDAYVRTLIALEWGSVANNVIALNTGDFWTFNTIGLIDIEGNNYYLFEAIYKGSSSRHVGGILPAGDFTYTSLAQIYMTNEATNEDVEAIDGNKNGSYDILVFSQAVQTAGFANAEQALDTAFGDITTTNHPWVDSVDIPVVVDNIEALADAIAAGKDVILADDIEANANTAITVASGTNTTLNLNGHTITATADKTGNQELFLVKGNMTVENGSIELTAQNNQGWSSMATIFDVTAGGELILENLTANVSGTDMNFVVHLNNWGSASVTINNCDFTTTYVAVRAFNSGYDMNNVTITNSDFHGGRMFWVHNYTSEGQGDATLNLDIYGNGNTCDNEKPVRFGFSDAVYYDMNGNLIQ